MAEPIPDWIEKHYIVGPRLGGGSFSDVYHVTGRATPTAFAVKILKAEFRNNPVVRSRFQTEAKAMAREATKEGLDEVFMDAGAVFSTSTCGPCLGGYMGVLAKGERCVSTTNRNFRGRMGHRESEVILTGPRVAAASAVLGHVGTPAMLDDRAS